MNVYFVDTSALAKRYIPEEGTDWVLRWILPDSGNVVVIGELVDVEMFSLLNRRMREGKLGLQNFNILRENFLLHQENEYLIVPLDSTVVLQARNLINKYPLRTLDAIQLACALQAVSALGVSMTFVSADNNLLAAAHAEGFVTDNPLSHP